MPLNDYAMTVAANALRAVLLYGQLHSPPGAGAAYTSNVITAAARQAISWATPTGPGTFTLLTPIVFTGPTVGTQVFSLTIWDSATLGAGNCYGEYILAADGAFNAAGYQVTMLDLVGNSMSNNAMAGATG